MNQAYTQNEIFKNIFGSAPRYSRDSLSTLVIKDKRLLGKWELTTKHIRTTTLTYTLPDTTRFPSDFHREQLERNKKLVPVAEQKDTLVKSSSYMGIEFLEDHTYSTLTIDKDTLLVTRFWTSKGEKDTIQQYSILNDSTVSGGNIFTYQIMNGKLILSGTSQKEESIQKQKRYIMVEYQAVLSRTKRKWAAALHPEYR